MVYRLLAILGLLLLLAAGLLAWQGARELPLWLGGAALLLMLPLGNRRLKAANRLPRGARERMFWIF